MQRKQSRDQLVRRLKKRVAKTSQIMITVSEIDPATGARINPRQVTGDGDLGIEPGKKYALDYPKGHEPKTPEGKAILDIEIELLPDD